MDLTFPQSPRSPRAPRGRRLAGQVLLFGWLEARSCAFSAALFAGLAFVQPLPSDPVPHYDLLLLYGLALTATAWLSGWESPREIAAIGVCHLLGLVFELVKVHEGSWSYPQHSFTKIAGVPLYSGFMYAAVGSYVCAAWRLLRLRLTGYRPRAVALVAAAIYLNFLTDQRFYDLRWVLTAALLCVTTGTWVHFTLGRTRHRMPLALAFVLTGFFLWLAENIATWLGAWRYPYQMAGWRPVSSSAWSSWALLITVMFVLVHHLVALRRRDNED